MQQLQLQMLTVYDGPQLVDREVVMACKTYRDAVRACWELGKRKRPGYTMRQLAEDIGCYPAHVTDYLHRDDKPSRRDLPARCIVAFESQMGNRFVSQWIASRARLAVIDEGVLQYFEQMRRSA